MAPTRPPAATRPVLDDADIDRLLTRYRLFLFDGVCPLCNGFVRFVLRRDRRRLFHFVTAQSALGQRLLARFDLPLADWDSYIYIENGRPFFKSDGVFRILGLLPRPWPWLRTARIVPAGLTDWVYDRVARNRYALFGRYGTCMVPSEDVAARFLE